MNAPIRPLEIELEAAVRFIESDDESGVGLGWRRARLARQLKHVDLPAQQRTRLVDVALRRLASGRFSQGFMEQLKLAGRLDAARVRVAAVALLTARQEHVRRYAAWVLRLLEVWARCAVPQPRIGPPPMKRPRWIAPHLRAAYRAADQARLRWLDARDDWGWARAWRPQERELAARRAAVQQAWQDLQAARERLRSPS